MSDPGPTPEPEVPEHRALWTDDVSETFIGNLAHLCKLRDPLALFRYATGLLVEIAECELQVERARAALQHETEAHQHALAFLRDVHEQTITAAQACQQERDAAMTEIARHTERLTWLIAHNVTWQYSGQHHGSLDLELAVMLRVIDAEMEAERSAQDAVLDEVGL